jgi:hypothetical protein
VTCRVNLARTAIRRAFEVRSALGLAQHLPACPVDAADRRGAEVWFSDAPSLEGFYFRDVPSRILVPADRPFGRQAFACAHELGHHELGHGTRLDEYLSEGPHDAAVQEEEVAAHLFAGALLMPRAAVEHSFRARGWTVSGAGPAEMFVVAGALGVSYEGLLTHTCVSLNLITRGRADELSKASLSKIRQTFIGADDGERLVVADRNWEGVAVDLSVGESVLLPKGATVDGTTIVHAQTLMSGEHFVARKPGVSRASHAGWSAFVRVQRKHYVGLGITRHLDDPDVE